MKKRSRPEWARLYVQSHADPGSVSKRDRDTAEKEILKWMAPTDEEFVRVAVRYEEELWIFNIYHDNHYDKGQQCFCGRVKKICKEIA